MLHTRACQQSVRKSARARCRLLQRWKQAKKYYTNKRIRCNNCCPHFVDMSLHNFSDFLCPRHEEKAIRLVSTGRSCRRQICWINRHNRLQKLRHKKLRIAAAKNPRLTGCPPDSLPASFDLTQHGDSVPLFAASQHVRLPAVDNYGRRKMFSAHSFGPPSCTCSFCGALLWFEERVKKGSTKLNPKFSICCQKGKVQLPAYRPTPSYLMTLLDYNGGSVSKEFRRQIRVYNSIFAFTSMGGNVDSSVNNSRGPYVFRLNGQNHHRIGSLLSSTGLLKRGVWWSQSTDRVHLEPAEVLECAKESRKNSPKWEEALHRKVINQHILPLVCTKFYVLS